MRAAGGAERGPAMLPAMPQGPQDLASITLGATVATERHEARGLPADGDSLGPEPVLAGAGIAGGVALTGGPAAPVPGPGRYAIQGEIARGGIGVVVRAADRDLGREVAIKVMGGDPRSMRARLRFVEEAQVTGQLEHPNIVPVHDLGFAPDGRPYFTMQLLKGRTLAEVLALRGQERWPLPRLVGVLRSICNGVAYAHSRGVVHRDLKPANIFLGDFGEVWLCDFGLAKVGAGRQWRRAGDAGARPKGLRSASPHLTQQGAIEGTPAYMAPEQAVGDVAAIDERTDIYALGAILYEILAGVPPAEGRDLDEVLSRVRAGRIIPPAVRSPGREPPLELSAVAMKALATDPDRRYQRAGDLSLDLEAWLEGRAVSAKEDSFWEALVKFVRRNKAVSAATAIAFAVVVAVVGVAFSANLHERRQVEAKAAELEAERGRLAQALAAIQAERDRRAEEQRRAAPALVESARRAAERRSFAAARRDADLAVEYDRELPAARLVRAHLLLREQDFAGAAGELEVCQRLTPDDGAVRQLADLAVKAADDPSTATINAIADLLAQQAGLVYAEGLYAASSEKARLYRQAIERAWPGATRQGYEYRDRDGRLVIDLAGRSDVAGLEPLAGMPVARLRLNRTRVVDLAPLAGAPLEDLDLADTRVRDLTPLAGAPLQALRLGQTQVADLAPVATAALAILDLAGTPVADLSSLAGAPLQGLRLAGTRVADLAPLQGMPLADLDLSNAPVSDLRPLAGMRLAALRISGTRVTDLAPLAGMPLTSLALDGTRVADLRPLAGMPLRSLAVHNTLVADLAPIAGTGIAALDLSRLPVSDLRPLARLPLASLNLADTQVSSLDGLRGLRLATLVLARTRVADLGPLRDMPLTFLDLSATPVTDLRPLGGRPLATLSLDDTPVTDLRPLAMSPLRELRLSAVAVADAAPLKDLPLERLVIDPARVGKGLDALRDKKTLRQIATAWEGSWGRALSPQDFWARLAR
ncbi:MAG: Serine/threonine-protein kinase PknB [Planctomycetota bacterium]|jgi:Leucine-rich repeat (LRR) protein